MRQVESWGHPQIWSEACCPAGVPLQCIGCATEATAYEEPHGHGVVCVVLIEKAVLQC